MRDVLVGADGALALAGELREEDALCERCGEPMAPDVRSQLDGSEGLGERTLTEIGLPPLHIVRGGDLDSDKEVLIEFSGDLSSYFGTAGGE